MQASPSRLGCELKHGFLAKGKAQKSIQQSTYKPYNVSKNTWFETIIQVQCSCSVFPLNGIFYIIHTSHLQWQHGRCFLMMMTNTNLSWKHLQPGDPCLHLQLWYPRSDFHIFSRCLNDFMLATVSVRYGIYMLPPALPHRRNILLRIARPQSLGPLTLRTRPVGTNTQSTPRQ